MTPTRISMRCRNLGLRLLGLSIIGGTFSPLQAQSDLVMGAAGLATGTLVGAYTTTAIYVGKARTGRFLFSPDELISLRLETVPMVLAPIAGTAVGVRSESAFEGGLAWGGMGFIMGAVLGGAVGQLAWPGEEGRWAGAILGSATGLLVGFTLGARDRWNDERNPAQRQTFGAAFSLPAPTF